MATYQNMHQSWGAIQKASPDQVELDESDNWAQYHLYN